MFGFSLSQNNSISPSESLRTASEKHRSSSDYSLDSKKRKVEEKDRYVSLLKELFDIFGTTPKCPTSCAVGFLKVSWKIFTKVTNLPLFVSLQDSDGEKSDDLVVDVSNEVSSAVGNHERHVDMW